MNTDPADYAAASETPDKNGPMALEGYRVKEFLLRILTLISTSTNAALYTDCVAFVLGVHIRFGEKQSEIARRHNVTRANVSKICVYLGEVFEIESPETRKRQEAAKVALLKRQKSKNKK